MTATLNFSAIETAGAQAMQFAAGRLVCCGWAGRDARAVAAHIEELAALGVPRPGRVPTFMNLSPTILTQADGIDVVSGTSSGEVEYVLLCRDDQRWVSVGSDHTDRDIETRSIPASKQMCGKYVADACWPYAELADHWDDLVLRSWVVVDGSRTLYQESNLASILGPAEIVSQLPGGLDPGGEGVVIFSGTIATRAGLVYGERYELELEDPVRQRRITGAYRVNVLAQHL